MNGNFAKEWVEYPFLAIPANVDSISDALESIHTELSDSDTKSDSLVIAMLTKEI